MVRGRFCEPRELGKDLLVCFCLESFPYGFVLGALADVVLETELSKLARGEKARRAGVPTRSAEEDFSRDYDSVLQADEMVRKFEDVRPVDLNIFCYGLPDIRVLGKADTVIGPEDTEADWF